MLSEKLLEPAEWNFWQGFTRAYDDLCRELERGLQREFGVSKAEFTLLSALADEPGGQLRVGGVAEALGWEKSRVAHQVTRTEAKGLVEALQAGASGRRTGIRLTPEGLEVLRRAREGHGQNIRRLFLDSLTLHQAAAIGEWSAQTLSHLGGVARGSGAEPVADVAEG